MYLLLRLGAGAKPFGSGGGGVRQAKATKVTRVSPDWGKKGSPKKLNAIDYQNDPLFLVMY